MWVCILQLGRHLLLRDRVRVAILMDVIRELNRLQQCRFDLYQNRTWLPP